MGENTNIYLVDAGYTVKETIEKMEKELIKAVVVTDKDGKVIGLFSNGDMRSYFLKGGGLSGNITKAMNPNPVLFYSEDEVIKEREERERVIYPIVDAEKHIVKIVDYSKKGKEEYVSDALKDVPLVIMAGGKGTRLYPYTKILPKPLIPIGDLTITERIIASFRKYGCNKVLMILNHKAGMIKSYLSDIEKDYDIDYVVEKEFLGTAGGLKLVKDKINNTFFVSNCDIVIDDDLECAYRTHKLNKNIITFICSMKNIKVPYGVVETSEEGDVISMKEKPEYSVLINTGVYVVEPEIFNEIGENEVIHMPDLAQRYIDKGKKIGVFPISEKAWMDMGQISEMQQMIKQLGV